MVAPSGVHAVETKARRKRKAPPGKRNYETSFKGKALEFPCYTDTESLEKAAASKPTGCARSSRKRLVSLEALRRFSRCRANM